MAMAPGNIRKDTLAALRGTQRDMSSAKWLLAMKRQPKATRRDAAVARLEIDQAILALGNAKLRDIGAKLTANEAELRQGARALRDARGKLDRVKTVLGKIDALLQTVGKIVSFISVV
jgi:hypothetical protein